MFWKRCTVAGVLLLLVCAFVPEVGAAPLRDRAEARRSLRLKGQKLHPLSRIVRRRERRRRNKHIIELEIHNPIPPKSLHKRFLRELTILTNAERTQRGVHPLKRNAILDTSARLHAEDMFERDYFAHDTPEGISPKDRMMDAGYPEPEKLECRAPCRTVTRFGENLAKGGWTPAMSVKQWMDSPGHRRNLLSPEFTEIGFGIAGNVWAQNFGSVTIEQLDRNPE